MTLPNERLRAIENTRQFLLDLIDRSKPIKTRETRQRAGRLLRHYPTDFDMSNPSRAFGETRGKEADMDAITFEILDDDFKAGSRGMPLMSPPLNQKALRPFSAKAQSYANLFGENEEVRKCLACQGPFARHRKDQKFCSRLCKDEYRHKREAAAKLAVRNSREREALAWIKEHPEVIYYIVSEVKNDPMYQFTKIKIIFRRFWENARKEYPEIAFDNNHSRFVSRYIMEHYPELAGVFRTRN